MENSENDKYVVKIEVEGTDIKEYYEFDEPVSEERAKLEWLGDIRNKEGVAKKLANQFEPNVVVTKLWTTHSEQQEEPTTQEPIILEPPEEEDDEETSI